MVEVTAAGYKTGDELAVGLLPFAERILAWTLVGYEEPQTAEGRKSIAKYLKANGIESKIAASQEAKGVKVLLVKAKPGEIHDLLIEKGRNLRTSGDPGQGPIVDIFGTKANIGPGQFRSGKWAGYTPISFPYK